MARSDNPPGKQSRPDRSGNPAVRAGQPKPEPRPPSAQGSRGPRGSNKSGGRGSRSAAGRPRPATVAPEPMLPLNGVAYPQILRTQDYAPWRSIVGVLMGLSFFVLLTNLISQLVVFVSWALFASGEVYRDYFTAAYAFERPSGMLAANLGIATLIPVACVLMMLLHRMKPSWLLSVPARVRWPYFWACLGVAVIALNGVLALSMLAHGSTTFALQPGFWGFLVVILLTSPIQAAAEEFFFRGYLLQALGSLFAQPWIGIVLSAGVFAFFHGAQNLPLFIDRFAFGLLAAVLVWRTGGIEAGVAAHVVNNVFAYVIAGLTTSIAAVKAIREIGWLDAVFDVGGFAVFGALALLVAVKLKPATRVALPGASGPGSQA
ncbi:CPBP family intramembrane glutamic endopeptidase [Microlunatus ginsengisoli]|uniref:CAAX prenyl protease 2/Lysostaphin resistance protein A-like domain-containing protein n=1 Tax=Microlunatus ginsengisoli TaxID=363863 RepID=A0ABP7AVX4_9ACTN